MSLSIHLTKVTLFSFFPTCHCYEGCFDSLLKQSLHGEKEHYLYIHMQVVQQVSKLVRIRKKGMKAAETTTAQSVFLLCGVMEEKCNV